MTRRRNPRNPGDIVTCACDGCDMYLVQHKVTQPDGRTQGIWIEMPDSRYTETQDLGDENCCPFFISRTGPALEEFGA